MKFCLLGSPSCFGSLVLAAILILSLVQVSRAESLIGVGKSENLSAIVEGSGEYKIVVESEIDRLAPVGSELRKQHTSLLRWLKDPTGLNFELLKKAKVKKILILEKCLTRQYHDDGVMITVKHESGFWSKSFLDPALDGQMRTEAEVLKPIVSLNVAGTMTYCVPKIQRIFKAEIYRLSPKFFGSEDFNAEWQSARNQMNTQELINGWIKNGKAQLDSIDDKSVEEILALQANDHDNIRRFLEKRNAHPSLSEPTSKSHR